MTDWTIIIEKAILVVSIFGISLVVAMYSTYGERKIVEKCFLKKSLSQIRVLSGSL